ncbi:hypothetical protein IC615_27910 [Serratia ureilytica]
MAAALSVTHGFLPPHRPNRNRHDFPCRYG